MEKKVRVLVVDDEPDLALCYKIFLENEGFEVHDFTDPLLALSNFKPGFYDLLVLDIRMPHINGFELYKKMKEMDKNATAVLFLTTRVMGDLESFIKGEFPSLGDESLIYEPIEREKFLEKVNEIMGKKYN